MSEPKTMITTYIGVYTHCQNSGKTFVSVQLTDAIARLGHMAYLIDGDKANANKAGTSFTLLQKKPRRHCHFNYGLVDDWDQHGYCEFAIFDTSRKPTEMDESSMREDCALVIIPAMVDPENDPNEKSLEDALAAVWSMQDASVNAVVLPILRNGGTRSKVEAHLKGARSHILRNMVQDEPLAAALLNRGDLLVDCDQGDETAAQEAEERFDALAAEVLSIVKSSMNVVELAESA